ncbi:MAG TPA: hypothetical protein ENK52_05585 [Saprospiraceae bacterium]|nr:hypothetical protein [Saprospiraceae bacterium]
MKEAKIKKRIVLALLVNKSVIDYKEAHSVGTLFFVFADIHRQNICRVSMFFNSDVAMRLKYFWLFVFTKSIVAMRLIVIRIGFVSLGTSRNG